MSSILQVLLDLFMQMTYIIYIFMFSSGASAKCPIILAETGGNSEEFEAFEAETFLRRLFGKQIPSSLSLH